MATVKDAGLFRKICTFKKNVPTQLGAGKVDNYVSFYTTRGYLKQNKSQRLIVAAEIVSINTAELYVRFKDKDQRRKFEGKLSPDTKVFIEGNSFTMVGWSRTDEKYFEMCFQLNVNA